MLANQQYDTLDSRVLENFGINDLSNETLQSYRRAVATANPEMNFNALSDLDFLRRMGAWAKDRDHGIEGLTVAGLLMFGQYHAILDEFPDYFLDYQERAEGDGQPRYLDRVTSDATWSGNLYDFYWKVYPRLVADLKVGFQLNQSVREDESPAHVAVREALVNALVHADYALSSPILVLKSAASFIFHNPGTMRVPLATALKGGESDSRNKRVQDMFRLVGNGERQGFGIHKILENWRQFDWRRPHFTEDFEPKPRMKVSLMMASLFPPAVVERLVWKYGESWEGLDELKKMALVLAAAEGAVTHRRLSEYTHNHPREVSDLLVALVSSGDLETTGAYRSKTYHIPGEALPTPEEVFGSLPNSEESLPNSGESLPNSGGSLPNYEGSLPNNGGSLSNSGGSLSNLDELGRVLHPQFSCPLIESVSALEPEFRKELEQLAQEPRQKLRIAPDDTKALILMLCKDQFVTAGALAELLNREVDTLRGQYLTKLKNEGKLLLAFPRTPTDPKQAYLTI